MKLIRMLEEMIEEEIHDVKKYAKLASEVKAEHPSLAQTLYTLSTQEDTHQSALHSEVVKIIENYRKNNGEPPAAMMAVYEYIHQKHIDNRAEARRYQEVFRDH